MNITSSVGVDKDIIVGSETDQQKILDALYQIRFIKEKTTAKYMNEGGLERWRNLIGDFQIQFMVGKRGIFASEKGHTLHISKPDFRIDSGGNTLKILNTMLKAKLLISVSIDRQMTYIIKNGNFSREYRITSGSTKSNTPVGLFRLRNDKRVDTLEEARNYKNDTMQYAVFFTSSGHALHTGEMVSRDKKGGSHGCVRQIDSGEINPPAKRLWNDVHKITSKEETYIPNAYTFIFDRPVKNHKSRRGDILKDVFKKQGNY